MVHDVMLSLYNTLAREKQAFKPIDSHNVRMYVCGPTVYDYAHIGNARPAIVFDVLFRLLRHLYGEDHVTYVRNITDVDDKINARALRDFGDQIASGKLTLNEAIRAVTEKTATQYHEDMAALGCLKPTHEPRATDFVLPRQDKRADMVTIIQRLIDSGHAYLATGEEGAEVLFSVPSMPDYGALSKRRLDEQQAGARVAVEAHKRNAADFVLWKESAADQPGWDATFTIDGAAMTVHGRPGWHIECSAMSAAYLGEVFDIHGGGLDLIFPHHENEIAQSRCAFGHGVMANYWMHNGFLQVEGRKMSKSEGNFVTVYELLHTEKFGDRKWPGEVLRLAMLMTHYREPIDFSVRRLEEAEAKLEKWLEGYLPPTLLPGMTFIPKFRAPGFGSVNQPVLRSLSDDLNTPKLIHEMDRVFNDVLDGKNWARDEFNIFLSISGLGDAIIPSRAKRYMEETEIYERTFDQVESAVERRLSFIRDKNWAEADRIRDELLAQGIQLKDGKDPATGERITTWEVKR